MILFPQTRRRSLILILLLPLFPTTQTLSPNLTFLSAPLGINCRGSALCPSNLGAFPPDYIGTLLALAYGIARHCPPTFSCGPLNDTDIYLAGDHIACLPIGESFLGGICAYAQGNAVPKTGVTGVLVKRKLRQLSDHGCRVCGSVPLGEGNDPSSRGILTVNYVGGVVCWGLCPPRHYEVSWRLNGNVSCVPAGSDCLSGS